VEGLFREIRHYGRQGRGSGEEVAGRLDGEKVLA
jgi:hypothetical protein